MSPIQSKGKISLTSLQQCEWESESEPNVSITPQATLIRLTLTNLDEISIQPLTFLLKATNGNQGQTM